ncbi:MAG: DUF4249 domain-containing protein [Bacteroidales bacterium]|nr:DUF4249 domain-containing protein [Bacteroidales bacterium]
MTNRKIRYPILLAALPVFIGLFACEKTIDISIPDQKRKIVVNGLISQEDIVSVNISRSLSVLEDDNIVPLHGADVSLFQGTDLIGKLQEGTDGDYSLPDFKPQTGLNYHLTVSGEGMEAVEALAAVPQMVQIVSLDTATITQSYGAEEFQVSVKFNDPPAVRNFYSFGIDIIYKEIDYSTMEYTGNLVTTAAYLNTDDSDDFIKSESSEFEGKLYFEDLLFDGMTKTVNFVTSGYNYFYSDTIWLNIRINQIDPSFFRYIKSYMAYQDSHGNPFSEPVQVFTNVTGGYGIFAGTSTTSFLVIKRGQDKYLQKRGARVTRARQIRLPGNDSH